MLQTILRPQANKDIWYVDIFSSPEAAGRCEDFVPESIFIKSLKHKRQNIFKNMNEYLYLETFVYYEVGFWSLQTSVLCLFVNVFEEEQNY